MGAQPRVASCSPTAPGQTHSPRQNTCSWSARGSQLMPSARVFGPWPEHSNPAASCLQWSCALQAEAVDTFFFFACAHLTRGRCCTSDLIAPVEFQPSWRDEHSKRTWLSLGRCCLDGSDRALSHACSL